MKPPVIVHINERRECWCEYGPVTVPDTTFHHARIGHCIHLLDEMPPCTFFSREWVHGLNFQAVAYLNGEPPVIASRRADVVTLAFDAIGPVKGCKAFAHAFGDGVRWSFRMLPMVWSSTSDERQTHGENLYLGVWVD